MTNRPDRPLVVKCVFDKSHKKITFSSSQNCSLETLRKKISQCFSLSASAFAISWKDDDGETIQIDTDDELTDAIVYFGSGDDAHSTSAASILSGRSFGRGSKVTIKVFITVDYDGPSLSDTSSLASIEEYQSRGSFSLGSPSIDLDDDSITVSSKDHLSSASGSRFSHVGSKVGFDKSSPTVTYPRRSDSLSFADDERGLGEGEGDSFTDEFTDVDSEELADARRKYPANPSAVFERLKIREALGDEDSDWDGTSEEDRGAKWLRDQNARAVRATIGIPRSSSEEDDLDLFDQNSFSLERGTHGQYYYNLNTTDSQSHQSEEQDFQEEDVGARLAPPRPTSMHLNWITAQRQELEEQQRLQATVSQLSLHSPPSKSPFEDPPSALSSADDNGLKYYGLEAPPAEILTACSHCNNPITTFRYICSTCGENEPIEVVKARYKPNPFSYPPRQGSANSSPTQTYIGSVDSLFGSHAKKLQTFLENPPLLSSASSSRTRLDAPSPPEPLPRSTRGYELCSVCFEQQGVNHSIETGLGSPTSGGSASSGSATMSTSQQDSAWRTSAPKKGFARHAFLEKYWGEFGWESICDDERAVSVCTLCNVTTEKQRYKCPTCDKFYLCRSCYQVVHLLHPAHAFILVPDKQRLPSIDLSDISHEELNHIEEEPSMEHSATCTHCMLPIVGALFHCPICENVDICQNCEAAGLPGDLNSAEGGHNSSHILLKIPYTMPRDKLQSASRAAMLLWRSRDAGVAISSSHALAQSDAMYAQTVIQGAKTILTPPATRDDHQIPCNHCGQTIFGTRYQCAHCPSYPTAYNLCSHCEERSWTVHDPMHIFFKFPRPVQRPLESRVAFLPPLYAVPAGPQPGSTRVYDPKHYLKDLRHTIVLCDRCMKHIEGEWFHCACCPVDLCDACESVDTHSPDHNFIVFKSVVDLQKFKAWNNPENPTPIIEVPVYD